MKDWRPKLSSIDDPIADDHWQYRTEDGAQRISHILIGRPAPVADGKTWYCPLSFEHVTKGIEYAYGVGPVDALMNAMYFVRRRFYEFDDVTPRAKAPRAKPPSATSRPRVKKRAAPLKRARKKA
ncbi:hypothetical protein [Myxococcus sp. RHSTA-1-4]|uniref:hypothetical protein n=1 Tax=Myxococcus sp. RHSTA-1-4 TaxID=2874601 RepID=UPI001CC0354C|nr:hypothetical protein [Myxococcus sp. RHSTA-1-4]MBZ4421009.1 hypothetical protein [Myxococcus sp. RHSTA-1-4]